MDARRVLRLRPLARVRPAGPLRSWPLWRLGLAAGALGAAGTTGWAVASVRHRPRGHDVVARMSFRQAAPDPGRASDGPAVPVVLVHGLGMSSLSMRNLVKALGVTTWALAPDLPGYGRSPQPRVGMLGVHDLGRSVLGWMDERGIPSAVLVGHSLGAQVAGEVALLAPERVERLVLIAPTGDPTRPSVLLQAARLLRGAAHEPPLLLAIAVVDYLRAGPGQMVMLMRRAVRRASRQLDVTVDVPLLVVRGALDRVCTQAWCEQIVSTKPGSRLVVVPDTAHGIAFDAPTELVELLRAEVRATEARA